MHQTCRAAQARELRGEFVLARRASKERQPTLYQHARLLATRFPQAARWAAAAANAAGHDATVVTPDGCDNRRCHRFPIPFCPILLLLSPAGSHTWPAGADCDERSKPPPPPPLIESAKRTDPACVFKVCVRISRRPGRDRRTRLGWQAGRHSKEGCARRSEHACSLRWEAPSSILPHGGPPCLVLRTSTN